MAKAPTRSEIRLSDAQWTAIESLLPELPKGKQGGRPWAGTRATLDGILWVLKTGARWRDLPASYPSPATCWRRLKRWEEDGTWLRLWQTFLGMLDEQGKLDWEEAFLDGTFAPAKKGATRSAKPSGAREQSSWWQLTAMAFRLGFSSPRRRPPKSDSPKQP